MARITSAGCVLWSCLATSLVTLSHAQNLNQSQVELKQVIVLSRHGVRGPYGLGTDLPTEQVLKQYVRNPDITLPFKALDWGTSDDPNEVVSPKITKHGYQLVQNMGQYFGQQLYPKLLKDDCNTTFAYADDNQRDNETARAFLSGILPRCHQVVTVTAETRLLFEQGQDPTANCPVCSQSIYQGIMGANDTRYLVQENHELIQQVNDLIQCCANSVCTNQPGTSVNSTCDFFGIDATWKGAFYSPWRDAMSDAEYFTEWLLLQALNNMTLPANLTLAKILQLSELHERYMDFVTNQVNSANFGATLLAHITASLHQTVSGSKIPLGKGEGPHLRQRLDNKFLYYAGHDINLMYLRNLLRMEWYSQGWHPHQPTPGGMLLFELYFDPNMEESDSYYIKAYFMTASPTQMRQGENLTIDNPPERVEVTIPLCSEEILVATGKMDVRCSFAKFRSLVGKVLKHECVADTLRPYVDSLVEWQRSYDSLGHAGSSAWPTAAPTNYHRTLPPVAMMAWVLFICFGLLMLVALVRFLLSKTQSRHVHHPQQQYGTADDNGGISLQQRNDYEPLPMPSSDDDNDNIPKERNTRLVSDGGVV